MDIEQLVNTISPETYQRLMYAVETGRWPEGERLADEQRSLCMQAVMLYQSRFNADAEHMSVSVGGEISMKSKRELKSLFSDQEQTIVRVNPNDTESG